MARRDRAHKDKQSLKRDEFVATITTILEDMQSGLFARAKAHREQNSKRVDSRAEFEAFFGSKNDSEDGGGSVQGGFALAHYSPDPKVEDELKAKFAVTCRCIPIDGQEEPGVCIFTGRPSTRRAVFAKSY